MIVTVPTLRPEAPATVPVWVAARDLSPGAVLARDDVRRAAWPRGLDPPARVEVADLIGRTVVTPMLRGLPLTAASVLGRDGLAGHPGRAAVAVRLPDPDVAELLAPGDAIDLWVGETGDSGQPHRVVADARVLAVPEPEDGPLDTSAGDGRVVVLAVDEEVVGEVATAATRGFLSVAWSR